MANKHLAQEFLIHEVINRRKSQFCMCWIGIVRFLGNTEEIPSVFEGCIEKQETETDTETDGGNGMYSRARKEHLVQHSNG